jgi:hypothetical protein
MAANAALLQGWMLGMSPATCAATSKRSMLLDVLPALMHIAAPALRPVSQHLYSSCEQEAVRWVLSMVWGAAAAMRQMCACLCLLLLQDTCLMPPPLLASLVNVFTSQSTASTLHSPLQELGRHTAELQLKVLPRFQC